MNDDKEEFMNLDIDEFSFKTEAVKKLDGNRYWVVYRVEKKQKQEVKNADN